MSISEPLDSTSVTNKYFKINTSRMLVELNFIFYRL